MSISTEMREHFKRVENILDEAENSEALIFLDVLKEAAEHGIRGFDAKITKALSEVTDEPKWCGANLYPETLETPREDCEEFALEGEDYCKEHL